MAISASLFVSVCAACMRSIGATDDHAGRGRAACSAGGCAQLQKESSLLQVKHAKLVSQSSRTSSSTGPCAKSCSCWKAIADEHTCGARIQYVAGPLAVQQGDTVAAAVIVEQEYPTICSCAAVASHSEVNLYEKVDNVGAWGGWCTCPNGQRYNVGDQNDACGSLACVRGFAGECQREVDLARKGMKAVCAAAPSVAPTLAPMPVPTPAPTPAPTWSYKYDDPIWSMRVNSHN